MSEQSKNKQQNFLYSISQQSSPDVGNVVLARAHQLCTLDGNKLSTKNSGNSIKWRTPLTVHNTTDNDFLRQKATS